VYHYSHRTVVEGDASSHIVPEAEVVDYIHRIVVVEGRHSPAAVEGLCENISKVTEIAEPSIPTDSSLAGVGTDDEEDHLPHYNFDPGIQTFFL
jgi:hypothetical protein